jgi:hypothetical protein
VVHKNAIASLEPATPQAGLHDQPGGLVAGNDSLVAFRALAKVLMVDATDIGAADGRCFYLEQNLAMPRFGYGNFPYFNVTVSG